MNTAVNLWFTIKLIVLLIYVIVFISTLIYAVYHEKHKKK